MLNKSLKISILALVGIAAIPAQAQVAFSVKGGVNMSNAVAKDEDGDTLNDVFSSGMGYQGGIGVDVGMGPIGVTADVLYTKRAIKFDLLGLEGSQSATSIYIPVQAKFSIIPMLFVTGGVYYAMGIGEIKTNDKDGDELTSTSYDDSGRNKTDFGAVAGLGVALPLGVTTLSLEARYNYGLSNMTADADGDAGLYGRSIDILAGVTF